MASFTVAMSGEEGHCGNSRTCFGVADYRRDLYARYGDKEPPCQSNCPGRKLDGVAWLDEHGDCPSFVYFIQCASGQVKIGRAVDIQRRLKTLQISHHEELTLLAVTNGGQWQENLYHNKFRALRIRGEWFEYGTAIKREVNRLRRIAEEQKEKSCA